MATTRRSTKLNADVENWAASQPDDYIFCRDTRISHDWFPSGRAWKERRLIAEEIECDRCGTVKVSYLNSRGMPVRTVPLVVDGTTHELDLDGACEAKFRAALRPWLEQGREVKTRAKKGRKPKAVAATTAATATTINGNGDNGSDVFSCKLPNCGYGPYRHWNSLMAHGRHHHHLSTADYRKKLAEAGMFKTGRKRRTPQERAA